jgi:hypothetical protein
MKQYIYILLLLLLLLYFFLVQFLGLTGEAEFVLRLGLASGEVELAPEGQPALLSYVYPVRSWQTTCRNSGRMRH